MANKTVADKLLFKPGMRIAVLNAPDDYERLVGGLPRGAVRVAAPNAACDAIHLFVTTQAELRKHIAAVDAAVTVRTLVWVSYPKRTGKHVKTDLTRDVGWDAAIDRGLEGVLQIAVSAEWSALRFRRRVKGSAPTHVSVPREGAHAATVKIDASETTAQFETTIMSLLVRVPAEVYALFGGKGRVPVAGVIQGTPFRSTIVAMGGVPCVSVKRAVREAASVSMGDRVTIKLARDATVRVVDPPPSLATALKNDASARTFFASLSFTHQREYAEWITDAKREATRTARVAKTIALLRAKQKARG